MNHSDLEEQKRVLSARFASGEIDQPTYERLMAELQPAASDAAPEPRVHLDLDHVPTIGDLETLSPLALADTDRAALETYPHREMFQNREMPKSFGPVSHGDLRTAGSPILEPGEQIGIYQLVQPLGKGGMGQVWKAHDTQGDRFVALKLLPPEFQHNADAIAQVRSAFQVVHQLNHRCLCKTLGLFDDPQHGPYIVMDFVDGITLSEYRRRLPAERLSVEQTVSILSEIADALDYAHHTTVRTSAGEITGVLHRDVKPQNIMLCVEGDKVKQVALIDLGLAAEIRGTTSRFTKAHVDTRGTRPYMSPEQLSGKRGQWDGRTDQYSLAVVAYEMLSGYPPFEADDDSVLMQAIKNEEPNPVDGLAPFVNAALLKGLSKKKEDRFGTCGELIEALTGQYKAPGPSPFTQSSSIAAPFIETITAIPAPQIAASELPPLPDDIRALEARVNGLNVAIDLIDQGKHRDIRAAWKALEHRTISAGIDESDFLLSPKEYAGQPLIEALKEEIEKHPAVRDSTLCAMAPDAPQSAMLVLINAFRRLVELKQERASVEQQLRKRQEQDFRGILESFLAKSEATQFPLAAWMKLEPLLAARRYAFVRNVRELLQKAEEHFASICEEREEKRIRLARQREESLQRDEAEPKRHAEQSAEKRGYLLCCVMFSCMGALSFGLTAGLVTAYGWFGVFVLVFFFALFGAFGGCICGSVARNVFSLSGGALTRFTFVGGTLCGIIICAASLIYGDGWYFWWGLLGAMIGLIMGFIAAADDRKGNRG